MDYLDYIARKTLGLETLDTRHSDDLDFHDLSVWELRSALEQAAWAAAHPDLAERRMLAGEPFDHLVGGSVISHAA